MEKSKEKSSFLSTLFVGIAGIGIGLGAKYLADEYLFDKERQTEGESEKKPKESEPRQTNKKANEYDNINEPVNSKNTLNTDSGFDDYDSFLCPIGQEIMTDPVITPKGITYDRKNILNWLKKSSVCPITKTPLSANDLITNYSLKNAISEYLKKQDFKNE